MVAPRLLAPGPQVSDCPNWPGRVLMGTRVRGTPLGRVDSKEDAMAKLFPCLWFDGKAEEAASFYETLLPNSHVDKVWRSRRRRRPGRRAWC